MLQNTTKLHFGSNGVEWIHLVRNHFHNFGTSNSALTSETQDLHLFTYRRFPKCSKRQPYIIWGPMEYNGGIWCEIISQLRHTKHKFCIFLHVQELLNAPKHNRTSFWVKWSRIDAFGVKPFSQLW
jgi:hypothetical protein